MSLEGRDIYTYLTDVSLSHCRPAHLHATEITPQGFTLHWQMMGTGDSLRIVVDDLFDTIVDATPGQCRIERSDWTSSSLQVRVVATCQQMSLECQWQTVHVELPSSPLRIPSCLTLDDVNTTRERSSNNMPYGWTRPYGNDYPRRSSSYRYGSTGNSLEFYAENYSYNRSSMVVSPYIDDNISSAWLEFYIRNGYSRSYFLVGTMTDPTDTATFVAHDTLRQYNDLTYVSLSLANYGGHYLAFRYQADPTNNSGYGYIDNLSLTSCPMPTAWISQPQDTTLGISWDTPTPVWIEYKQGSDFLPGPGTRVLATESPTTIGGLLTATPYTFHVWPQCEAGEEFSCNYRTLEYTTLYPPVAPPYCVNFENYDYYNNYPAEWDRWNPSYTNCYVYTSTGHEDSKSLRLSTYTTGGITYRPVAILPRILPSSLCTDSLYVNFWYKRDWSNSTLAVGIVTDLMDTNTFVPYDTLDATNEWQHHTTALPTAVLHTGRIAVKELTGAAYIDNLCIETCIAAEVAVAVNCENFDDAVADIDDRNIECAAAKVIDHDLLIYFVVKAVSQSCCCRLVDDTLYFKTSDLAGVLCRLALCIVEVCRNRDNSLGYLLAQVCLSVSLQFLKDHSGDFLRCVGLAAHCDFLICSDLSLDGSDRVVSICNCLTLCRLADKSLA